MDKGMKLLLLLLPCCVALILLGRGLLQGSAGLDTSSGQEPGQEQEDSPESFLEQASQSEQKGLTGAVDPDFRADTGESSRRMATMLEYHGKLYYADYDMKNIYCCNVDGSENRLFLTVGEERALPSSFLLAAGQYICIGFSYYGNDSENKYFLELYTEEGDHAGSVPVYSLQNVVYDEGYFYYLRMGDTLYRIREDGSGEEMLSEDRVRYGFQNYDGKIYYMTDEPGWIRIQEDGSGRENLSGLLGQEAGQEVYQALKEGVFYKGNIYYWHKEEAGGSRLIRTGLDGNTEILLSAADGEIYDASNTGNQVGNLLVFQKIDASGLYDLCTYNMDTEEMRTIFHAVKEEDGYEENAVPLMAEGASRIYYQWQIKEDATTSRHGAGCSINPAGGGPVNYGENIAVRWWFE